MYTIALWEEEGHKPCCNNILHPLRVFHVCSRITKLFSSSSNRSTSTTTTPSSSCAHSRTNICWRTSTKSEPPPPSNWARCSVRAALRTCGVVWSMPWTCCCRDATETDRWGEQLATDSARSHDLFPCKGTEKGLLNRMSTGCELDGAMERFITKTDSVDLQMLKFRDWSEEEWCDQKHYREERKSGLGPGIVWQETYFLCVCVVKCWWITHACPKLQKWFVCFLFFPLSLPNIYCVHNSLFIYLMNKIQKF